jgi:hypothetical protein
MALHRALGLAPWEMSPFDVDPDDPPPGDGTGWYESWPLAVELQRELQKAVRDA